MSIVPALSYCMSLEMPVLKKDRIKLCITFKASETIKNIDFNKLLLLLFGGAQSHFWSFFFVIHILKISELKGH